MDEGLRQELPVSVLLDSSHKFKGNREPERAALRVPGKEDGKKPLEKKKSREERYDSYIRDIGREAAAIGKREPWHLIDIRRHKEAEKNEQTGNR